MKVLTDEDHYNADTLRVYTVRYSYKDPVLQICANLENTYKAGDTVAVARLGHDFGEGYIISERRIRGVLSQGMLLGKFDGEMGADITDQFRSFDPS
jgi:tRNA-binding EMAP/Myf-like protein